MFVPRHLDKVADYRVTRGTYEDGEQFVLSDYWKASRRPERFLHRKWKGSTEFIPSRGRGSEAPNSAARWLTPRSPGNPQPREEVQPVQEMRPRWTEADEPACGPSVETPLVPKALRPLESRMRSAERYYAPQDVQEDEVPPIGVEESPGEDGLGHHGDPEGQAPMSEDRDETRPMVVRAPREPTQKERDSHEATHLPHACLLYTSPSPRDKRQSRMPSSA